jgi:hypothetical protein
MPGFLANHNNVAEQLRWCFFYGHLRPFRCPRR